LAGILLIFIIIIVVKKVKISNSINSEKIKDYYTIISIWLVNKIQRISYSLKIKKLPKISLSLQQAIGYLSRNFSLSATGNFSLSKSATASCGVLNPDLEIKQRNPAKLSNIAGMEVYSSEGNKIGVIKEVYIEDNKQKVYGWLIKIKRKLAKKIGKKFILVKHNLVFSIEQIMIIDKKVLEYLENFNSMKESLNNNP